MEYNNNAGRLYNILSELAACNNMTIRNALAKVLDKDAHDTADIIDSFADVLKLLKTIKTTMEMLPDNGIFMDEISKFELALSQGFNFESPVNHLTDRYSKDLRGLLYCADILSRVSPEVTVDQDELSKLLEEVNRFFNDIIDSELPSQLKHLIVRNLEFIRRALADYKIHGVDGLKEVLESCVGSFVLNRELVTDAHHDKVETVFGFLNRISILINLGQNGVHLLEPIIRYLSTNIHV